MEFIILLVLLAIASSAFQFTTNNNKKQKQIVRNTKVDLTKTHQNDKKINRPINSNTSVSGNTTEIPIQNSVMTTSDSNIELNKNIGSTQTESLPARSPAATEQSVSADYDESQAFPDNITMDELQKSIVMAEILGKPKALRKSRI